MDFGQCGDARGSDNAFFLRSSPSASSESGIVEITQPILPNGQILVKNVIGAIRATGYGNVTKVVSLSGQYIVSVPPSGIQYLLENFYGHRLLKTARTAREVLVMRIMLLKT